MNQRGILLWGGVANRASYKCANLYANRERQMLAISPSDNIFFSVKFKNSQIVN